MALTARDQLRIGMSLYEEGKLTEALYHLREAEAELPPDYDLHLALGRIMAGLGERPEAVGYFRRCIDADPARPEAYLGWAEVCRKQGRKEQAEKLELMGNARGGKPEIREKEVSNWEPEATAPKQGDVAFSCPACDRPILNGEPGSLCPNCRLNLQPLRHGHIVARRLLDGHQELRCARCDAWLNGREYVCPECETNLMTGESAEPERAESRRGLSFRSPAGVTALVIGFLLLCFGIGQFSVPGNRREAAQVWSMVAQRVTQGTSEGVRILTDTKQNPNLHRELQDSDMLWLFTKYFGLIVIGGSVLLLGWMKYYFDRLN